MGKSENDIAEETAAQLAWAILHCSNDYEIVLPVPTDDVDYKFIKNGEIHSVGEVKRDVDGDLISFDKLQAQKRIPVMIDLPAGYGGWTMHLDPQDKRAGVSDQQYVDLVSLARSEGFTTWQTGLNDPEPSADFLECLKSLGVSSIYRIGIGEESYLMLQRNMRSGTYIGIPDEAEPWIAEVIAKHGEKRSFERFADYQAPEAHIFVIIDSGTPENIRFWASMGSPEPFAFEVELPKFTTHLFVGANVTLQAGERRVWVYRPGRGWSFYQL
jgi:hypothetical protein